MSPGDNVTKLHNKGAIIDGTSVLVSSINWGDSAMLRNREVGLLIHHAPLAAVYHASWTSDWNRVDATTDSDNDGLLDAWEIEHDLNRARRSAPGNLIEAELDPDGDGLDHLEEFNLGSDPNSNDTDGDCILDDVEVLRAQADASGPNATARLTMVDADGDGVDDHTVEGCTNEGVDPTDNGNTTTDGEQNQTSPDDDVDLDGVPFADDRCPATPRATLWMPKVALRIGEGCSSATARKPKTGSDGSFLSSSSSVCSWSSREPWVFATRTTNQI